MTIEHLHGAHSNFYTQHLHRGHKAEPPKGEEMKYVAEVVTVANVAKLVAGGFLHKIGAYLYAKYRGAEARVKAVVADVRKDLQ